MEFFEDFNFSISLLKLDDCLNRLNIFLGCEIVGVIFEIVEIMCDIINGVIGFGWDLLLVEINFFIF